MDTETLLEPIVGKVEEGEPLTEPELKALSQEVERQPGNLDWLLCLAHALVNSERPAEALRVAERAAQIKPGEPLVLLARARALGALERFSEAERDLRQVLSRYPGHADAMRALALLRLRAGAPEDAARLARSVLEADPLDEATHQILAEAEAASSSGISAPPAAQPESTLTREEFAEQLSRSFAERGLSARADAAATTMVVRLAPGHDVRLSLDGLRSSSKTEKRGQAWFIEDLVGRLAKLHAPERTPALEEVRERLFPVLRPPCFLKRSGPALQLKAPAGLLWLFAIDHPDFVSYVPPEAATRWGLPLDELLRIALGNLERKPIEPARYRIGPAGLQPVGPEAGAWDLLAFDSGDGYDASRLLSPAHLQLLARVDPGPWVVAIPVGAYAVLARASDAPKRAVLKALAESESSGPEGLCSSLFSLDGGRLESLSD
jgi:tetratricopeptide (TPR) repeat protein